MTDASAPTANPTVQRLLGEVVGRSLSREQIIVVVRVLRKHRCLIEFLDALDRQPNPTGDDWRLRFELAHLVHRQPEAALALEQAVKADPTDPIMARRAVEFFMAARDNERALEFAASGLKHNPEAKPLLRLRAVLCSYIRADQADEAIGAAWRAEIEDWWCLIDCWARIGRYDRIDAALNERLLAYPEDPTVHSALGRMALWRGNTQQAAAAAEAALRFDSGHREAHFIVGAVAVLEGRSEGAEWPLERAIEGDGPTRWLAIDAAWTFRACMLRALGKHHEGKAAASSAMFHAQDYNVAAHVARITNAFHTTPKGDAIDARHLEIASHVHDLVDDPAVSWNGRAQTFMEGMAVVERRLSGNRSAMSTWVDDDGVLRKHTVPDYPRHLARMIQLHVRCRPPSEVLREFERLESVHPNDPTVHTYRGEFRVWLGDYGAAANDFHAAIAIDERTTWAWIGLAATQMCQGEVQRALDTLAQGIVTVQYEGPTVFVYRGEAHRLLGNFEAAITDLETATREKPQRLSAWINRALVADAMGNPVPYGVLSTLIAQTNPSLWSEALGQSRQPKRNLEACLTLMLGNRSSTILTYRSANGTIRLIDWNRRHVTDGLRNAF